VSRHFDPALINHPFDDPGLSKSLVSAPFFHGFRDSSFKDDKRAIFTAASHAQKAADYLHGLQSQEAQP
jgi:antirestriction protein ArdC